jgi:hypothetical protein
VYKDSKKFFKKFPEDAGKWCNKWDLEYNRQCKNEDNDDPVWKMEWCEKTYCLVPKDCELDDTEVQYEGKYAEEHGMDQMWSSKNCDESLYTADETAATTASP